MTGRAVVMEVKDGTCTVLTAEGEFRRLKLRGNYRPGQEITIPDAGWRVSRVVLMAACLLLFFVTTALWRTLLVPAVASYVSLDINPSVELALDEENVVCGVKPLDDDGKELVSGLKLSGATLENALDQIITAAIGKNYIQPEEENIILFTVTPVGNRDPSPVDLLVRESIDAPLKQKKVKAQVVVGDASPEIREMAEKAGVSTGRYMLFQNAVKKGMNIEPEDFRRKSIYSIEKDHKIKIKDAIEAESGERKRDKKDWFPGSPGGRPLDEHKPRQGDDEGRDRDIRGSDQVKGKNVPGHGKPSWQEGDQRDQRQDDDDKEKESKKGEARPEQGRAKWNSRDKD
ncbi:MAG: anti-sigma factor domain-containing protein [Bacillota bacterium]